jgi:hypothetical protein
MKLSSRALPQLRAVHHTVAHTAIILECGTPVPLLQSSPHNATPHQSHKTHPPETIRCITR